MSAKLLHVQFYVHKKQLDPAQSVPLVDVKRLDVLVPVDRATNEQISLWLTKHPEGKVELVIQ